MTSRLGVHFTTGRDDWETPPDLFQRYDDQYHFVLDAAANESNHKVDQWFGPGGVVEDALAADWAEWLQEGNIWLNPPYSRGLQQQFVRRAANEYAQYPYDHHIICLLPARTDTKLFHDVILPNASVEFLRGRVKFVGGAASAPFPSMVVVF